MSSRSDLRSCSSFFFLLAMSGRLLGCETSLEVEEVYECCSGPSREAKKGERERRESLPGYSSGPCLDHVPPVFN